MGVKRRGAFVLFVLVFFMAVLSCWLPPLLQSRGYGIGKPTVSLPAEVLIKNVIPGLDLTNGLTSAILVFVIVLAFLLPVGIGIRRHKKGQYVPKGIALVIEVLTEYWKNQVDLGKFTGVVIPAVVVLFLTVATANIIKAVPGVESVGLIACAEPGKTGYPLKGHALNITPQTAAVVTEADLEACEAVYNGLDGRPDYRPPALRKTPAVAGIMPESGNPELFTVVPFFKPLATDLNFTLALAIVTVLLIQVWGVQAQGGAYFFKFLNIPALGSMSKNPMGVMDFAMGFLELISELARVLSFSMRLLFAVLAGSLLLGLIEYLSGFGAGAFMFAYEMVIGLLQAFVFALLAAILASQAVTHTTDGGTHD